MNTLPVSNNLITQILQGNATSNWEYWLLVLAFLICYTAIYNFIKPYVTKRGEALATQSDFQLLLKQLEIQTKATEQISADISHQDWTLKEYKTLRRNKLEKLVELSINLPEEMFKQYVKVLAETDHKNTNPINELQMIKSLYFPEMRESVAELATNYQVLLFQ
jgi:hypothetical protein